LMMALKQQLTNLENQSGATAAREAQEAKRLKESATGWRRPSLPMSPWRPRRPSLTFGWRRHVVCAVGNDLPWEVAARGGQVVYADGSWSFLHKAQVHLLQNAREHGEYLLVGVHSDQAHQEAVGSWPAECFAARASRLRDLGYIDGVLEGAPWVVSEDMLKELGITKVVSGFPMSKLEDCSPPATPAKALTLAPVRPADPYEVPRLLKCFYTIESLSRDTEHEVWMERASRILFSNVDASIDWRVLVRDGAKTSWGKNPGYAPEPRRQTWSEDGGSPILPERSPLPINQKPSKEASKQAYYD